MENFPVKLEEGSELLVDIAKHQEEKQECYQFLIDHFVASYPMSYFFELNEPGVDEATLKLRRERPWLLDFVENFRNICIIVRDDGVLAGLAICSIEGKSPTDDFISKKPWEMDPRRQECSKLINALTTVLEDGLDLYSTYQTDRILSIHILTVHPTYARRGIAKKSIQLSIQIGENQGAGAVEVGALNQYTFQAAVGLGFEILADLDLATFEMDGTKPFENDHPILKEHPKARFLGLRISQ